MKPPSTLLPPPVTAPVAVLRKNWPLLAPANPPATLAAPTVTLPLALEAPMKARLKNACPSPIMQLGQLKFCRVELEPTNPPALLLSPVCTLPVAVENRMTPALSPTRPPACRFATPRLPTLPRATEPKMRPWLTAASPPNVVDLPWSSTPPVPAAPVTLPVANALSMMPLLKPTSPPPAPFEPTVTAPVAQAWPAPQLWVSVGSVSFPTMVPKFCPTRPPATANWQALPTEQPVPLSGTLAVEVTLPVA